MLLQTDYYQDDCYYYRSELNLDATAQQLARDRNTIFVYKTLTLLVAVRKETQAFYNQEYFVTHVWRLLKPLETPLPETCERCDELQSDCDCRLCPGCGDAMRNADRCENCEKCPECCECAICNYSNGRINESHHVNEVCERCEHCSRHCECAHCGHCRESCEYTCANCDCCDNCCECTFCPRCEESRYRNDMCRTCDNCSGCCECDEEERDIPEAQRGARQGPRKKQSFRFFKPENLLGFKQFKSRRAISIELEIATVPKRTPLMEWANKAHAGLVSDGSIPKTGCEINTNPAVGDQHVSMMQELSKVLQESEVTVTNACGLHVHVDASDISQYDLRKLMIYWVCIEPSMFELVSKTRYGNDYCKIAGRAFAQLMTNSAKTKNSQNETWNQRVSKFLYEGATKETVAQKREKYHSSRYYAINLHSYFFRKTIEFRLHEARIEPYILLHWPILCGSIIDFVQKQTEKDLLGLAQGNKSSEQILFESLPLITRLWAEDRLKARREDRQNHGTVGECVSFLNDLMLPRNALRNNELWFPTKSVKKSTLEVR